jgi:predicted phosphodiesterase
MGKLNQPEAQNHPNIKVTSEAFRKEFAEIGAQGIAKKYGMELTGVYARRRRIEQQEGIQLVPPTKGGHWQQLDRHPAVIQLGIQDGEILVGSDAHFWPGSVPTAYRAFLEFAKERKPKVIVLNGDVMDFPSISRFAPIAWESRPTIAQEIENAQAMLSELEKVSPRSRRIWCLGNHDGRYETRLATVAPEYQKVFGVHLKDAFPNWEPTWAAFINDDIVIKHRARGGIHNKRNSTLHAGRTTVCGHSHDLGVDVVSDYNGPRWGVNTGMLADPYGPQFYNYTEVNAVNWRSGFALLTIKKQQLLWPEVAFVSAPNTIQFRGKEWTV